MLPPRPFAGLLALSLIWAAAAATPASVDRPAWTAGDFWTYRTNTTLTPGLNLTGTATSTMTGTQTTVTGGASVDAFRVVLAGSGTASGRITTPNGSVSIQGRWTLTGEEHFEPRNLHPIYSLIDLSVNGTYEYVVPIPFSLRVQNTTTFQVLSDGWPYPWTVATGGNVTMAYNFTQDLYSPSAGSMHETGSGQWTLRFSLSDAVSLATGAGTFVAYPLREDLPDGTWQRSFFSPAIGNAVRTESYEADGNLTAETTLMAYRYQAAETPPFLGLTSLDWAILAVVAAAAAVLGTLVVRRSRRKRGPRPPGPDEITSGPRGP